MDKNTTIYIVSGYMRTGTSMMMKALEAGGLDAAYRQSRETMRKSYADKHYDPNIGGLYELESEDYNALGFPEKYQGKLIKVLMGGISSVNATSGLRVIFMRRDFEEIRQSYMAFFDQNLPARKETFEKKINLTIKLLQNRKDLLSLDVFWYSEVIKDPRKHFQLLKDHGWEINVEECVKVIDPQYYRFRKENLTEGII
jgi:hypothetical protein